MPPKTAVPTACWLADPAPDANTSGSTPTIPAGADDGFFVYFRRAAAGICFGGRIGQSAGGGHRGVWGHDGGHRAVGSVCAGFLCDSAKTE